MRFSKKKIFEKYKKDKNSITESEYKWMDKIDWHPVDEMELRPEFVASLLKRKKCKVKKMTFKEVDELFRDKK